MVLKKYKLQESSINDERLKLISDMVVGCRTIKCFGWENHYIEKLNCVREKQRRVIIKVNVLNSLGNSFFQNTGLVAILAILGI